MFSVIASTAANAKQYRLTATGTVSSINSRYGGNVVEVPPATIKLGDNFKASAVFDTSSALLTSLYDADPRINIYYLSDAVVDVKIGDYRSTFAPPLYLGNFSLQLWNDYPVVGLVDNQSFEFYDYPTAGPFPFDLPGTRKQQSLSVNLFDFNHAARTNDLISQIAPASAFGSQLASYSFNSYDSSGNDQRFNLIRFSNLAISLISEVPEPRIWFFMLIGFASIGQAMRKRTIKLTAFSTSFQQN